MVTGKVSITRIGFTMSFNRPKTTATIMAETYPSTLTPGNTFAKITTATAVSSTLRIVFMNLSLNKYKKKSAFSWLKADFIFKSVFLL